MLFGNPSFTRRGFFHAGAVGLVGTALTQVQQQVPARPKFRIT